MLAKDNPCQGLLYVAALKAHSGIWCRHSLSQERRRSPSKAMLVGADDPLDLVETTIVSGLRRVIGRDANVIEKGGELDGLRARRYASRGSKTIEAICSTRWTTACRQALTCLFLDGS
jgi:hypothetical protein